MKVHLGGSLAWYEANKRSNLEIPLTEGLSLNDLLLQLAVPRAEVAIISINGELFTGDDTLITDADTVHLYPPIGGGRF